MTEDTSMHLCCSLDILMGSAAIHWLFRSAAPVTFLYTRHEYLVFATNSCCCSPALHSHLLRNLAHNVVDNYPLREVDNARGCVHIVGP